LFNNAVIDAASDPTALDNQVRLKVCSRTCGTVYRNSIRTGSLIFMTEKRL